MSALAIWTVYDHPTDQPHFYVARRFEIDGSGGTRATESALVCPDLDQLRTWLIEMGLTCIARSEDDDPKIVETWL